MVFQSNLHNVSSSVHHHKGIIQGELSHVWLQYKSSNSSLNVLKLLVYTSGFFIGHKMGRRTKHFLHDYMAENKFQIVSSKTFTKYGSNSTRACGDNAQIKQCLWGENFRQALRWLNAALWFLKKTLIKLDKQPRQKMIVESIETAINRRKSNETMLLIVGSSLLHSGATMVTSSFLYQNLILKFHRVVVVLIFTERKPSLVATFPICPLIYMKSWWRISWNKSLTL